MSSGSSSGSGNRSSAEPNSVYYVALNSERDRELMKNYEYPSNYIRTTKYTVFSFIPLNLFNQFKRFYNIYFLLAAALSFVPNAGSISPVTQVSPLIFVLAVTMIKDGIEDWNRYRSDKKANNIKYFLLKNGERVEVLSKHISAGDIVIVRKGDRIPCDLLLLSSSNEDGTCFIETSQLDGESNLKRRSAISETALAKTDQQVAELRGRVETDFPNNKMNFFQGRFVVRQADGSEKACVLGLQQTLLRGTVLRNTDHAYGMCIYAGVDTKIIRNLQNTSLKFSSMEKKLNRLLIGMFVYNAVILAVSIIMTSVWESKYDYSDKAWYIYTGVYYQVEIALQAMTFYILYTYTIPISLFTTLELVRVAQSLFIYWDENLKSVNQNGEVIPTTVRNSNLNEDLGRIEYIFSDKTGTLTQNIMRLSKWYVNGTVYNEDSETNGDFGNALFDPRISDTKKKALTLFARCVAICHTAIPIYDSATKDFNYESESPDESALLQGIKRSKVLLKSREKDKISISIDGKDESFRILDVIEFSSDRRRMTIIVETSDGIHLYCKGADQKIFERLSSAEDRAKIRDAEKVLNEFSHVGLRTLAFAWSPLPKALYEQFHAVYTDALLSFTNKEEKIDAAAKMVERDLLLLGCSAIEDKLQDEVPETIEYLLQCGIKLWVLTGDKRETAINIAKSCRLFTDSMNIMIFESESEEESTVKLAQLSDKIESENNDSKNALVLTGDALATVVDKNADIFLKVTSRCHSVVCCRVSPLQKAQVVKLVRKKSKKTVLSVGDGANDVSMIQAANVGVGIVGMEGAQAVRASDFSIGEFRCLKRLIAVHGRYNNIRQTKLIYYSLYKNIAMITVCFWFGIYNAWSGYQIYQETFLAGYNIVFASLPPLFLGIFEKDIVEEVIYKYPQSFISAARTNFFKWRNIVEYLVFPIWHSVVIFFGLLLTFAQDTENSNNYNIGYWMMVWCTSTAVMTIINLKFLLKLRWWADLILASVLVSLMLYYGFVFVCWYVGLKTDYNAAENIFSIPVFYLYVIIVSMASLLPDYTLETILTFIKPSDTDILREKYSVSRKSFLTAELSNNIVSPADHDTRRIHNID